MIATNISHAPWARNKTDHEQIFIPLFTIYKQYSYHTGLLLVPNSTLFGWGLQGHPSLFPLSDILLSTLPLFPSQPKRATCSGRSSSFSLSWHLDIFLHRKYQNFKLFYMFVCFLSSPLDPQIRPCHSIYHCKPVPSTVLDTKFMLSKLFEWLHEWTRIF